MKKSTTLICAAALIGALCAGFVACDEPKGQQTPEQPEVVGTAPVPVAELPEEVSAFFEKHPVSSFTFFDEIEGDEPMFLTINSQNEFNSSVSIPVELPHLDFNNYTLVVGSYYTSGGVYLKSHSVDTKPETMVFHLVYGDTGKGLTAMFQRSFWSLYPKLPQKAVAFKTVTIKEY